MTVYFNDSEPFVCDWLENLIREKLLPDGVVDRRPIQEVEPKDVQGFTQCHFFAGIGGWAYALQLAGWGDREAWTGSCPCPPFSSAGRGRGFADDRHVWPVWGRLIRECHPPVVFGEQVAAAIGFGWLDLVAADLESQGYAVAAAVLGAHSAGAPHQRQRLWFVADANQSGLEGRERRVMRACTAEQSTGSRSASAPIPDSDSRRCEESRLPVRPDGQEQTQADTLGTGEGVERCPSPVADSEGTGGCGADEGPTRRHRGRPRKTRSRRTVQDATNDTTISPRVRWDIAADGWRIEPDVGRVAHGVPARVGRLRAYGNAIVPQVAAAFIRAYLECDRES